MIRRLSVLLTFILSGLASADSGFDFLRTEKTPFTISAAQTSYLFHGTVQNAGSNPASVFSENTFDGIAAYTSPEEDENTVSISASYTEDVTLYGLAIDYMSVTGLEGRELPSDDPAYEFEARSLIASFTYARKFGSGLTAGITAKYLFEKVEYEDSYGFAGSLGIFSEDNLLEGLRMGLAVNNIGSMSELDSEKSDLPLDVLFGAGYGMNFADDLRFSLGNSTRYLINDEETENFTGIELGYQNKAFVRFGYRANNEGQPFSAGLGFAVSSISFDYSYTPFSEDEISDIHAFSIGYAIK